MKKTITLLLCVVLLLLLAACQKSDTTAKTEPDTTTPTEPVTPPEQNPGAPSNGTTLMIYMVGSDLEAKGGAGTKDMEEILESQVDLSGNNVLLYAGGTKRWHNDNLTADAGHSILQLTQEGYQALESREEASMGEADTLAYFLNYAYDNYKTGNYALILWDHGNGPLIGYGKDMLHEDDTLTLLEMQEALNASPFKAENKLAWVGFDACLMSSVELACIWQEHAEYLIASQEVEPSFGWNYAFLQQLGKVDTKALAGEITKQYLDSCLAYYKKRNFDQRDTTLACMDLSQLAPLKTALEDLFETAEKDVASAYSEIVSTRVNARALGRATTGSEYDLIDLVDMATQLKSRYPDEAEAVITAAKALVVHNATNAENCCGLSLYYPFYNKSYYEKAWNDVYQDLNAIPAYVSYLQTYSKRWLGNDLLQTTASSVKPQAVTDSQFTLTLTEDQAENFADASYYILQREGNQIYTRIYTSSNVTKKGNSLIASFDGNVLYAKNKFNQYWLPAVDEHDTVGDYTRFSTYVNLTNQLPILMREEEEPEGYAHKVAGHRFHISVNNATQEIKTAALVPWNTAVDTDTLVGGKQEDADLSAWSQYIFLSERHIYLERDENGTILPLEQWEKSGYLSGVPIRVDDGVEFVMAPIPAGEYYLIYEIEDVQGNRYCSELLPIESKTPELPDTVVEEPVEMDWKSGDRVKLFEEAGLEVWLTTVEKYDATRYALQVENKNDFDVAILGSDLLYNDYYDCSDGSYGYFYVPAGETVTGDGFDFGNAEKMGMLTNMESLQFAFKATTATGDRTLIYRKAVSVNLSAETAALRKDPPADSFWGNSYYQVKGPARGLFAEKQVVFEHEGLRCTLLALGGKDSSGDIRLNFCFENTSDDVINFRLNGIAFDNVFCNDSSGPITVYPGTAMYYVYYLSEDDLDENQIHTASSVSLSVSFMEFATLTGGGGFAETISYPISLTQKGGKVDFRQGETLLYRNEDVQIYLKEQINEYGTDWILTMVNNGDRDLMVGTASVTINGKAYNPDTIDLTLLAPHDTKCPAGLVTAMRVSYNGEETDVTISYKPQFYDFEGEELLWEGTEITLKKQ